jgi:AraC-like DNA-binding protein
MNGLTPQASTALHRPPPPGGLDDALDTLLRQQPVRAHAFLAGRACGTTGFADDPDSAHLHLLQRGHMQVRGQGQSLTLNRPHLLFLPRPPQHWVHLDGEHGGADAVCASIRFGAQARNPIAESLPDWLLVPLEDLPGVPPLVQLMFDEAARQEPGRQSVLDQLCGVLILQLLRHCMRAGLAERGALAGLAHPRLGPVLAALHREPRLDWPTEAMASLAALSRPRFSELFTRVVGTQPARYLLQHRLRLAQHELRQGRSLDWAADATGFSSASALSRAFSRELGCSPREWLRGTPGQQAGTARHDLA